MYQNCQKSKWLMQHTSGKTYNPFGQMIQIASGKRPAGKWDMTIPRRVLTRGALFFSMYFHLLCCCLFTYSIFFLLLFNCFTSFLERVLNDDTYMMRRAISLVSLAVSLVDCRATATSPSSLLNILDNTKGVKTKISKLLDLFYVSS